MEASCYVQRAWPSEHHGGSCSLGAGFTQRLLHSGGLFALGYHYHPVADWGSRTRFEGPTELKEDQHSHHQKTLGFYTDKLKGTSILSSHRKESKADSQQLKGPDNFSCNQSMESYSLQNV